jgi:hypothetical protein
VVQETVPLAALEQAMEDAGVEAVPLVGHSARRYRQDPPWQAAPRPA